MSSFRWKREFDKVTFKYFNSHSPPKSSASRVIYLVLQFINLIYDERELLDFTALALPAGKNLTATCGIYRERKQHYIESFPYMPDSSQQVTENSKPNFRRQMSQRKFACPAALRSARRRTSNRSVPEVPFRERSRLTPRTRLSGSGAAGEEPMGVAAAPEGGGERGGSAAFPSLGCSQAAGRGRGENAGDEFSGTNIFPSIRRCPSAIAWTQVREGDGICDSLTPQYLCLKRVIDVAMKRGVV